MQRATSWLMSGREDLRQAGRWPGNDLPVLDMCASPGGKTVRLAAGWTDTGPLLAMDGRPGASGTAAGHDPADVVTTGSTSCSGTAPAPALRPGTCAAVLVDGPCSGTGVIRHHPEARWHLERRSPRRNGKVLESLAVKAADLLAPGGLLMYATCSLEEEENEKVIEAVLAQVEDLEPCPDPSGPLAAAVAAWPGWGRRWILCRPPVPESASRGDPVKLWKFLLLMIALVGLAGVALLGINFLVLPQIIHHKQGGPDPRYPGHVGPGRRNPAGTVEPGGGSSAPEGAPDHFRRA